MQHSLVATDIRIEVLADKVHDLDATAIDERPLLDARPLRPNAGFWPDNALRASNESPNNGSSRRLLPECRRLRDEPNSEHAHCLDDGFETRIAVLRECLVQPSAGHTRFLSEL